MSDGYRTQGSAFADDIRGRNRGPSSFRDREVIIQGLDLDELEEERVKTIIQGELDEALGQDGGELSEARREALKYYNGDPETGGPLVADRSQVVMRTVLEAVEWTLPALIRVFTASDKICIVEPPRPGMEEQAQQATLYLNHIFQENQGFLLIYDWFKDALLERLGWVKFYWDTQKTTETYSYSGQTEETYYALLGDDEGVETVRLVRHRQKTDSFHLDRPQMPDSSAGGLPPGGEPAQLPPPPPPPGGLPLGSPGPLPGPPPGIPQGLPPGLPPGPLPALGPSPSELSFGPLPPPPPPPELYDFTLRTVREYGEVKIVNVPPEEILFSKRAKRGDIPFLSHRRSWTYSDLIQQGYDEECLDLVPMDDSPEYNSERVERLGGGMWSGSERKTGDSGRTIWVEENYVHLSIEEDGPTTELYRVMTAGGGKVILTKDGEPAVECVDEIPFVSICPVPAPHSLARGLSLADLTKDLQMIKSTLMRQMVDNAFLSNWPRIEVADDVVSENTYDDLLTLRPGGVVRTRRTGGITPLMIPFTADKTFPLVQYLDETAQLRTGVSSQGQMVSPDALNNTAAASVAMLQQSAAQRVELFARIFAHGVEELMRGVMRLVRKNQQQERMIRVAGDWIKTDPRTWRQEMPVSVSVGLGTGNRDQILQHLMQIIQLQGTIVQQQQGVHGPLVYSQNVFDALKALQENAGFKSSFFADPRQGPPPGSPPPPPPQPDPKAAAEAAKIQASMQLEQMESQANVQAIGVKAQVEQRLMNEKAQADAAIQQQKLEHEKQMGLLKVQHETELERQKAENNLAVGMAKVKFAAEAKQKEIELKFRAGAYDQRPAPAPGEKPSNGSA